LNSGTSSAASEGTPNAIARRSLDVRVRIFPRGVDVRQHLRFEFRQELPPRIARLEELRLRVPEVPVESAVSPEREGIVAVPQRLRQPGDRLIGVGVFDGAGDRLLHEIGGQ